MIEERYPDLLRAFREEVGWTQAEAAKFVGVATRTWQSWEAEDTESGRAVPEPVLRLLALYRRVRRKGDDISWGEMNELRAALGGGLLLRPRPAPYGTGEGLGPAEEWRVQRDGDVPLSFRGWRLAQETVVTGGSYSTTAAIYLTEGGSWVGAVHQRSEGWHTRKAGVHSSAEKLRHWFLQEDGGGEMRPAAVLAWRTVEEIGLGS